MNNMNRANQGKKLLPGIWHNYYISYENNLLINTLRLIFRDKQENIKTRQSFILPFILNIIDINIPEGSETLTNYAFGVMLMSLVALLCFINVLGYFITFYVLDKYNIETRFPKLSKIKTYYQNTTLIFIIYESLFLFYYFYL